MHGHMNVKFYVCFDFSVMSHVVWWFSRLMHKLHKCCRIDVSTVHIPKWPQKLPCCTFRLYLNWIHHLQEQISSDRIKVSLILDIEPATSSILDMTDLWRVAVLYLVIIIIRRIRVILLLETAVLNSLSKLTVDFSLFSLYVILEDIFSMLKRIIGFLYI